MLGRGGDAGRVPKRRTKRARKPARRDNSTVRILYVATGLTGNARYGPRYWYGDKRYYELLVATLQHLAHRRNVRLKVKRHHKDRVQNPLREAVAEYG